MLNSNEQLVALRMLVDRRVTPYRGIEQLGLEWRAFRTHMQISSPRGDTESANPWLTEISHYP